MTILILSSGDWESNVGQYYGGKGKKNKDFPLQMKKCQPFENVDSY